MTAILFDLDGTLIDSLPNITDAANAVLGAHGLSPIAPDTAKGFVGHGEQVFVDRLIAATDLDPESRERVMQDFIRNYEIEARRTVCFPGAVDMLAELRASGRPLGLVTNKPRGPLEHTLRAAALQHTFDVVVAGDDLAKRKPDPLPLRHAMEALGATKGIYVGDSEVDAATAEAASVPFVLYTEGIRKTPVHELSHTASFNDFKMLPGILGKLTGA